MTKRSNVKRSPTEPPRAAGINYETGEMHGDRSRTDFAGSKSRTVERGIGGQARRGVEYPRPSQLLREAARVIAPGGRIGLVHYITAKPVEGIRFVRAFGLSTGFDMPMRAVSVYERDQASLTLGAG